MVFPQQLLRRHAERLGEARKIVDGNVANRALDIAQIGSVDPRLEGQGLLTEAAFRPQQAQIAGQNISEFIGMCAFHAWYSSILSNLRRPDLRHIKLTTLRNMGLQA